MADIVSNATLPTNLVSYYQLDETGGVRIDAHGVNDNDLTDNNTVVSATGIIDNGADFTRANSEYLSIADNASLSITGDLSVSCWVKIGTAPTSGQQYGIVNKYLATGNQKSYSIYYFNNSGTLQLVFAQSSDGSLLNSALINQTLTAGTWYHLVFAYDASAGSVEMFVNGSSIGTDTTPNTSIFDSTAAFQVGTNVNTSNYFDGVIDEMGIWSKVLTSTEITALYNSGSGLPYREVTEETIAYDTTTDISGTGTAVSTAHTVTGNNSFIVANFTNNTANNSDAVTSVTYNGTAMTLFKKIRVGNSASGQYNYVYYLFDGDADGASHNLVINSSTSTNYQGSIASWSGVDQGGFDVTANSDGTSGWTNSVERLSATTTVDNCNLIALEADADGGALDGITGGVIRNNNQALGNISDSGAILTAGAHEFAFSDNVTRKWTISLLGLAPAASTFIPRIIMS